MGKGFGATGQKQAENYLASAGLEASHTVAELEDVPFLNWVLQAHGEGLTHLAVNPRFEQVAACQTVETLDIQAHLQHAAEHMLQLARPDF